MSKATRAHHERIRREIAIEMGLNPDKMTGIQEMRLDVVLGLKSGLDATRARMLHGEPIDVAEMKAIATTLESYLPATAKSDGVPSIYKQNPRKVLEGIVDRMFAADEATKAEQAAERVALGLPADPKDARIAELEAELATWRAGQPAALPAPDRVIDPPTSAIMPPSEQSDRAENMRGPVAGQPKPPVTIDAKPVTTWPDGTPLPPGGQLVNGKVVPIPPRALSGDESKRRAAASNSDRATPHRIMTQASRVSGEPAPSTPMTVYGDSGFCWQGAKGREW